MENYIFRIYKENGTNAISGWDDSSEYGLTAIKQIVDPNENANEVGKEPTSIPSPFARIDLVKTAFSLVAEKSKDGQFPHINGNSIYNRIVSNTLDVAQLFFESNRQPNLEIIPWSFADNLENELLQSRNEGHIQLGETLKLYLERDGDTYNFSEILNGGRIFLLNYKGLSARDEINIIGATSPSTLFFCCDNDLSYIDDLKFQNDRPFDNDYAPLYERDLEFHKFLWALKKHIDNESVNTGYGFAEKFKEVNAYLEACYALSDSKRRAALNAVNYDDYEPISVSTENAQEYVEILGFEIKQRVTDFSKEIANHCGFKIKPTTPVDGSKLPLVLPTSKFTRKIAYVNQQSWDMNTVVPESDNRSLADRTLPGYENVKYPYLSVGDFLEDTIIKTPYRQNGKDFYCFVADETDSYLLPLKDKFFEYFTIDNLKGNIPGTNRKFVEVSKIAGGVKVLLRIPIIANGEYIEYNRVYVENLDSYKDAYKVVEVDFGLALMTNIKFKNEGSAIYNLALISSYDNKDVLSLACYKGNESMGGRLVGPIVRNSSESKAKACMTYTLKGTNFDYIRIGYNGKSSIVLPNFVMEEGADEYMFSIDFGTTNTHVEYRINGGTTIPFNIGENDVQLKLFSDEYANSFLYVFASDIMPQCVGGDTKFKLPMRTALSFANNTQWMQEVNPVLQAGVSFTYEKLKEFRYNATETNLKWSEEQDNIKKLECYIKSLFNILRNKVLLNRGDLAKTKVVWFYPLSMSVSRLENYKDIIINAYKEYFSDKNVDASVKRMSESVAPYIYYARGRNNIDNIVTIDIGGGTTDVVVAENNDIKAVSSFRFAANSIFGNGFANDTEGKNGIVNKFKQKCFDILQSNGESDLMSVYEQIDSTNNSVDMASFLFSLKGLVKPGIKDYVDFIKLLTLDKSKKITFLMFYSSIIYHVACLMKAKGLRMPNHIAFSGNGSRIVSVLTSNVDILSNYTRIIFEKVFDETYDRNGLVVILDVDAPKESTCKGGLKSDGGTNYSYINDRVVRLCSIANGTFFDNHITYEELRKRTDEYEASVVADVKQFIDFVFALHNDMRFDAYFNVDISQIDDAKEICNKYLETYFRRGLANRIRESGEKVPVEETMFFYPVIGILNALANELGND